jgi:hypothetical protein
MHSALTFQDFCQAMRATTTRVVMMKKARKEGGGRGGKRQRAQELKEAHEKDKRNSDRDRLQARILKSVLY